MLETLTFADGTVVPIIALYSLGKTNFQSTLRNQILARILTSSVKLADLQTLVANTTNTSKIIHTYDQTSTGADGKTTTTQKTQEYDNYTILHHISQEYNAGDSVYEYYLSLCQKTDEELQNETLKLAVASSLEG